jgi:putative ABC transport system ATP-binding protein
MNTVIGLQDVGKVFNEGRPNEYVAIGGVDLAFERGRITALKGPSGSGKTTLLTLIGCLARPTHGRISLDGEIVSSLPERFLTGIRRRRFGFVFQQFNLIKGLTALDNVLLPAYPLGEPRPALSARALALFERFRLAHRAQARVEWLSGGEQQRVAIARALINHPDILIADEPTANLDSRLAQEFLELLAALNASGLTVLLTSHDPKVLESGLMDRIVTLQDGRVVDDSTGSRGTETG